MTASDAPGLGVTPDPVHDEPRTGDVRDSEADLRAIARDLGYEATVSLERAAELLAEKRAKGPAPKKRGAKKAAARPIGITPVTVAESMSTVATALASCKLT